MNATTNEARLRMLWPDCTEPSKARYDAAWALLHPDSGAAVEWKAHAQCWLTYRAADGEVSLEDWRAHVMSQNFSVAGAMGSRWRVSQWTAEAYLHILKGEAADAWRAGELIAEECERGEGLRLWPASVLSYLRTRTLLAHSHWLAGRTPALMPILTDAVRVWQAGISSVNPFALPLRLAEARDDLNVLLCLQFLADKAGLMTMPAVAWLSARKLAEAEKKRHWMKCLWKLEAAPEVEGRRIFTL